ncbi:5-pentadecatrienyl resorcinol O-methyltransferase [Zea mays]|uniref:5-pentadecatrienyl resorcinol O-methyltransferase n=1 Tax=Zea mays TaxID=4577 RepID=K7WCJ0_MAIZE|nr:5-pentadecatrienyl resorcinol O-methyltransferase [Zea mays]AQL05850.1 5-pentadecatrienyl resorcinol O-methyltransferase [Zea mays]|eukprot:XP_008660003.1 5-pentadecatrienyl resorcinol O-methyltransferase [Zea mays]
MALSTQDLLEAHVELWHQSLCYAKSLALAVALDLRIPDAIHHHGGSATLPQILAETAAHPSKLRALRRLMRVLTVSGTFSVEQQPPAGGDDSTVDAPDEAVYRLTAASRFLVSDEVSSSTLAPFVSLALHPIAVSPHTMGICAWFRQEQREPSPYGLAFQQTFPTIWEHADDVNALLNKGMVADSRFLMPIMLRECGEVFRGIESLVDVGGGHGGATAAIAAAFPHLKCSVLDLPHVVAGAPSDVNVQFVAGNMFQSIPPATAVFLKTTLHDWGDDECVKILKNCRQAISPRDAGGKVIILDMVVGYGQPNITHLETQVMFDLYIMTVNGAERDEQEWKKIFIEAGFKDYKILPILGALSVIEVYP